MPHSPWLLNSALPLQVHVVKATVKAWLYAHSLQRVWDVARDYVFDYHLWLVAIIPCWLLETFLPAMMERESHRASRWLDFCYPVFGGLVLAPFTAIVISGIDHFARAHLTFARTGLLDHRPMAVQFIGAFLIMDFAGYIAHYLKHKVKWLWYFHAIHHSQENLNPFTANRAHFGDAVITSAVWIVPITIAGGPPLTWTAYVVLTQAWSYFVHSNVKVELGPLRYLLVSPQYHRIHHSARPEHWNKNFCDRLAIWDWLFGTVCRDATVYPETGVPDMESWAIEHDAAPSAVAATWVRQTAYPFIKIWESIGDTLRIRPPSSGGSKGDQSGRGSSRASELPASDATHALEPTASLPAGVNQARARERSA
jgi:sterol desaturase/sphingolipid hydroxylase (fatty acid hydroxylase superfamily)